MADKTSTPLFQGIGNIAAVAQELCNLPPTQAELSISIRECANQMIALLSTDDGKRALNSLICATQNEDFRTSGRLWAISNTGVPGWDYISGEASKKAIASLMGV